MNKNLFLKKKIVDKKIIFIFFKKRKVVKNAVLETQAQTQNAIKIKKKRSPEYKPP